MSKLPLTTLKNIANLPLNAIGLALVRKNVKKTSFMPSWSDRAKFAKKLGFSPKVIIDGGAFRGQWS
ncbi:MAG: hypothetical protein K8S16_21090, partial [Bacteroidales bacterium]|nr:hypothetical protein [Bacteroidales bacterium]